MQNKDLETNKSRLIKGGKTFAILFWTVTTIMTFSEVMSLGDTFHKVVAGIMFAINGYAIFRKMQKVWNEM